MAENINEIKERIMLRSRICLDEYETDFVDKFDLPKGLNGPVLHIKCPKFYQVAIVKNICTLRIYLANKDNIEIDPGTKISIFVDNEKIDDVLYKGLSAYKTDKKGNRTYKEDEKEWYDFKGSPYGTILLAKNRRLVIYVESPNIDIDREFVKLSLDILKKQY